MKHDGTENTESRMHDEVRVLRQRIDSLEWELAECRRQLAATRGGAPAADTEARINVSGIEIAWDQQTGRCTFGGLPVAMMWVDTTLAGLLSGVQTMVGTERFALALQSEGRNSVDADWEVIAGHERFEDGFQAIAVIAAVAGWGRWELKELNLEEQECTFRVYDSWEGHFQRILGVNWGSNMLAGKLAGYTGRLFKTNCWAEQTCSIATGAPFDEFVVQPSHRSLEQEIENLLTTDQATRADMAVALMRVKRENEERRKMEEALRAAQAELESRVLERTEALADAIERLKGSEWRFRSIFESSPMGIYMFELDDAEQLIFRGANPAAHAIVGVDHSRFLGRTIEEAFPLLAGTEIPSRYREVCLSGRPWHTDVIDYDDSREITGSFEVYAFKTGERTIAVLFLDVTERLKTQKKTETLQAELHRSKKMEALGLLAGGVAHDLNNILSGIVGYPELMSDMLPADSPMKRHLAIMEKSGLQAAAVVQDLLTIARGAATTREVIHINELVEEYVCSPEFRELTGKYSLVEVTTTLDPDLLHIRGSSVHVRKVLMNLVVNAVESVNGKGSVNISTCNRYLDTPLSGYDSVKTGEYVVLSVVDNGPGIASDDLQQIFEPFYTKKKMGRSGTGLGLAVVWNCVKDHGGYIDISTGEGGTCFNIYLHATRDRLETNREEGNEEKQKGDGQRILVVDDEAYQRELVSDILSHCGYVPHAVPGGMEACEYVKANPVDLVILDMIMPAGLSGRKTYEKLLEIQPGLPAIIVSGYAETDDVKCTLEMGAGAYLKKPFIMSVLLQTVHRQLHPFG